MVLKVRINRFWYDFEDCTGAKIVDFKKDKEYPLETIGDFQEIEKLLNDLSDETDELKSILSQTVDILEKKLDPKKDTRFAVTLTLDMEMYCKIKEILND